MTTVIRYRTPYLINNTSLLILSFTLGNDSGLRSVLCTPCLLAICDVVDLVKCQLACLELNQVFILQFDPPGKGLPRCATYATYFTTISNRTHSSVLPMSSPIQDTTSNGTMNSIFQNTHYSNLVVTINYFQGCNSRELVYHPPQVKPSELYISRGINFLL